MGSSKEDVFPLPARVLLSQISDDRGAVDVAVVNRIAWVDVGGVPLESQGDGVLLPIAVYVLALEMCDGGGWDGEGCRGQTNDLCKCVCVCVCVCMCVCVCVKHKRHGAECIGQHKI